MSVTVVVETSDLATVALTLDERVAARLTTRTGGALGEAASCTGMAGDDPAGLEWAAAYERSAATAAQAAEDVTNGAYTLAALLAATAQNYARAEAASTIDGQHAVDTLVANLPVPTGVSFTTRFDGVGGGPPNAPFGWSHVEHYVRLTWPNGHQDRLRQAGAAWARSAQALSEAAEDVELAIIEPLVDGLPEWRDIRDACWALGTRLNRVADAHRSLARSCEQFAHHLDVAHSKLLHEIRIFLMQSAAIEIVGNLAAAFTFGAAEVPTQGAEAGRIAATVAAIAEDIAQFALAVRELFFALPLVEQISATVTASMHDLLSVRIVWAEVAGVPGLRVLSIARDGRTASSATGVGHELGALTRLADDANLPTELRAALDSPKAGQWASPARLTKHFADHGSDFGCTSEAEYESRARQFFELATQDGLPTKVDEKGTIRVFDPNTNTFASYSADGVTRTFFNPTSSTYWERQPGRTVQ